MMNWINKKRNKKGFTLVELVVVIAILGILAGIAVPKLTGSREKASIAAHNANVRTLKSAATLAISEGLDHGDAGADITWVGEEATGELTKNDWQNYLQDWPEVPSGISGLDTEKYEIEGGIADAYTVTIEKGGAITVKPGEITEK